MHAYTQVGTIIEQAAWEQLLKSEFNTDIIYAYAH